MLTFIKSPRLVAVAYIALATTILAIGWQLMSVDVAKAQTTTSSSTTNVHLEKKFSGPVPVGYTPDMFYFTVSGGLLSGSETVNLVDGNDSTADGYIDLPVGEYTVTEHGPVDFIAGEWRPGWYGGTECAASSAFFTTLNITENTIEKRSNIDCQVDNQWRYGTLRVEKEFVGTTSPYKDFSFTVTQGENTKFDGPFTDDGYNVIVIAEGPYTVTEKAHPDYTPEYSEDCEGSMEFEDSATCTITNTYNDGGSGGGGGGDDDDGVLVVKKVIVGTTTVPYNNFSFNYTGASGTIPFAASGTNSISVATGTYSVTETPVADYATTYNNCTNVVVSVNATSTCTITNTLRTGGNGGGGGGNNGTSTGVLVVQKVISGTTTVAFSDFSFSYTGASGTIPFAASGTNSISVATGTYSVTETPVADYATTYNNCTNVVVSVNATSTCTITNTLRTGGSGVSGGGGGGSSSSGTRTNRNSNSSNSTGNTPSPTPMVLGEQVSQVPLGAANAGAGGTYTDSTPVTPLLFAAIIFAITLIRNRKLVQ